MSKPIRILISGYYGCGNAGDEAVLDGILTGFRNLYPTKDFEFTALSANVSDTQTQHGISAINRMSRREVNTALQNCDLFLSGGGSLLQDTTSFKSLLYYLWVIQSAKKSKKPVVYFAQGIGPLNRPLSRILTGRVSSGVSAITVRDPKSRQILIDIGVTTPEIQVTADPVFMLEPEDTERTRDLSKSLFTTGDKTVILALRPWREQVSVSTYREIISRLISKVKCRVLLLPMHEPEDRELAGTILDGCNSEVQLLPSDLKATEAMALIKRADLMIGMRLHALIYAANVGVPVIGLAYDPKVNELMDLLGQSQYCLPISDLSVDTVVSHVDKILAEPTLIVDDLGRSIACLRKQASAGFETAMGFVGSEQ